MTYSKIVWCIENVIQIKDACYKSPYFRGMCNFFITGSILKHINNLFFTFCNLFQDIFKGKKIIPSVTDKITNLNYATRIKTEQSETNEHFLSKTVSSCNV